MELIYICSRYKPDEEHSIAFNEAVALTACRSLVEISTDCIPIAPHLYFTRFMNDDNQIERNAALSYGKLILKSCSRMKVIVVDGIISEGMQAEINMATGNIPIDYFHATKREMEIIINRVNKVIR